jgi:hypothetical protein
MSPACRPNFAEAAYAIKIVEQVCFRLFFAVSAVHANAELCWISYQLQIWSAVTMGHKEKKFVLFY